MVDKIRKEGFLSAYDLNYFLTELKEQNPWLYEHHSKMLQMVSTQIHSAEKALVVLAKKGYKTSNLKFALYNRYNTFVYNQSGFVIKDGFLHLSKIGKISMILHREIPNDAKIKQIAISRQAGKWFACMTFDIDVMMPKLLLGSVGIDVGIKNFAYDSDGHVTPNPLYLKKMQKPLQRIQRKISRRQKGSQNRKKAIKWYQRIHQKIANMRKDFCHKVSASYAARYGMVYVEKLAIPNMVQNHKLSRNILDSGWSIFKNMLSYKTGLVLVKPHNTTSDCSRCGTRISKTLAVRTHRCNICDLEIDRDYNAAINILNRGLKVPQELREYTPVEIFRMSMKQEEATGLVQ
jgi:putative transposase